MCLERPAYKPLQKQGTINEQATAHHGATNSILVAVPATEDKKVDIFQIPSEQRIHTVSRVPSTDTGEYTLFKLSLFRCFPTNSKFAVEGNTAIILSLQTPSEGAEKKILGNNSYCHSNG
jgi:hypothetical protein